MAVQAPDARELKSWEDAFQYPLPVIRKLEQQLRAGVNDNREKVRALVGSGYRDLLGTADRIIDMNAEMHGLEDLVSDIGQKCSSRLIGLMTGQHEKMASHRTEEHLLKRRPAAEVALLQACLTTSRRLLSGNGDLLLVARLLLLARLLQNSAAKSVEGASLLKTQRLKLGALRTRLLSMIEDKVADSSLSRAQTLDILLAYSLVNTSSLADASRYLLRVRQQSIEELCSTSKRKNVLKAIDLLVATLEQSNSIFPRRLADAMERLTGPHLLSDAALREALDFDLALYEQWISNDIKSFSPWLRTNDLAKDNLQTSLKQWAAAASTTITSGIDTLLSALNSPQRVASLREKILRHLLSQVSAPEFDKDSLVSSLRGLFNTRLSSLTQSRITVLSSHITTLLTTELDKDHSLPSLWADDISSLSLRSGGTSFRATVLNRTNGKSPALVDLDAIAASWSADLDAIRAVVKSMRQLRWADEDDDTGGQHWESVLADEDPTLLSKELETGTARALGESVDAVAAAAKGVAKDKALFLLRLLRALPLGDEMQVKAQTIREGLHEQIADAVNAAIEKDVKNGVYTLDPAVGLWHGLQAQIPLPVMPSPCTVRLLRDIVREMDAMGVDVWTAEAVAAVRQKAVQVVEEALGVWEKKCEEKDAKAHASNGSGAEQSDRVDEAKLDTEEETKEKAEEVSQDETAAEPVTEVDTAEADTAVDVAKQATERAFQTLFDTVYLREILCPSSATDLDSSVDRLKSSSALDADDYERLVKNAQTYHRRSYLLFGLLA